MAPSLTALRSRLTGLAGHAVRRSIGAARWASGISGRERDRLDGSRATILMYHRILPRDRAEREAVEPGMVVTPETFRRHMRWLKSHFKVVPLHEIARQVADPASSAPLPPKACAITFDDGWLDNLEYALPILEEAELPATIFAVSERVGTRGGFWPDEVVRRLSTLGDGDRNRLAEQLALGVVNADIDDFLDALKGDSEADRPARLESIRSATRDLPEAPRNLLDWNELDRLAEAGIEIEVHGASHAILTGLAEPEIRSELDRSLRTLQERGHARHRLLAYPSGAYDARVVGIARELGYAGAVTTRPGLTAPGQDPLRMPRIGLHDDISRTRVEFLRWVPGAQTSDVAEAS